MARRWVILLHAVLEIFLSLLAVFGLFSLGWLAFGRILAPRDFYAPAYAVVPARGDGAALEQTVRALLWLRAGSSGATRWSSPTTDWTLWAGPSPTPW